MYSGIARKILSYFKNYEVYSKAKQLESLSAAWGVCYLAIQIKQHNLYFHWHCFLCRFCRILLSVLFERGYQKILTIVYTSNYNYIWRSISKNKYLTKIYFLFIDLTNYLKKKMELKVLSNIHDIAYCEEKIVEFFVFVTRSMNLLNVKSPIAASIFLYVLWITIWKIQRKKLRRGKIFFISHCCNFAPAFKFMLAISKNKPYTSSLLEDFKKSIEDAQKEATKGNLKMLLWNQEILLFSTICSLSVLLVWSFWKNCWIGYFLI